MTSSELFKEGTPAAVLVETFLEGVHRLTFNVWLRLQLLLLQAFSLEAVADSIAKNGINGVAVWVAETFREVVELLQELPGRIRQAFTDAMLQSVASLILDDPADRTVALTRQTAIDGVKNLLTVEMRDLSLGGVTTQWRFVKTLRRIVGGVGGLFKFLAWPKLIEAIILWLADMWAAVWDVGTKFVGALILIRLSDPEYVNRLFPVFSQSNPKKPAERKVWTREKRNQAL